MLILCLLAMKPPPIAFVLLEKVFTFVGFGPVLPAALFLATADLL
jgi:hypothetical protein